MFEIFEHLPYILFLDNFLKFTSDAHFSLVLFINNQHSIEVEMFGDKCFCNIIFRPGKEIIKFFSYSTQLGTKFILLINVKMPTIVGILTFISKINTTSERSKARNFFICQYFSFYEQSKFHAQLS